MPGSRTLPEDHDAQRALEQRSLRNVRALLDKLEGEAELERRTRRRIGWALVIGVVLAFAGLYVASLVKGHDRGARTIVIPPPAAQR
jgi:hypothetical protein